MENFRHVDLFTALVPEYFTPIMQDIKGFLSLAGESRCAELYAVCKDYNSDEIYVIVSALMDDLFLRTHDGINEPMSGENPTDFTYKMLLAAAYAAPVVVAFDLMKNEDLRRKFMIDRHFRRLLISAGVVMNLSGAGEIVNIMPDMKYNDPTILAGAVASLILHNNPTLSPDLIRYMGEHWRELAPFAETIESIPGFEVKDAMYLLAGGPSVLVKGAL